MRSKPRGSAAPDAVATWRPPARLVTQRLYRFTRNPMYVAVLTLLTGWACLAGSGVLLLYALDRAPTAAA